MGTRDARRTRASSSLSGEIHVPRETEADRAAFLERVQPLIDRWVPAATTFEQLDRYAILLYEQIASLALVSKTDGPVLYTRHILDSLSVLPLFDVAPECALDIGSGGGLPGIPLAIVWPTTRVVLLEARDKKAGFLERTVRTLALKNVRVACERLEEHSRKGEPVYDALFIRAVAEPYRLVDLIAPRCRPGARWAYFAGGGVDLEGLRAEFAGVGRTFEEATTESGGRLLHGPV